MLAPAFYRLRVKINTAFADAARRARSSASASINAPSSGRRSVGQGRTGFFILIAIVIICAVIVIGLPGWFGMRAEKTYREALRQTTASSADIKLDSYQRGWFSSRAVLTIPFGTRSIELSEHIHHGPLVFYDGWHVAFPIAAVVETDPPPALRNYLDQAFGQAPLHITTMVAMNGVLDTHIARGPSERSRPGLTVKFHGVDADWRMSSHTHRISGKAPGITVVGAFGEAEVAGISLRGASHRHSTKLWLGGDTIRIQRISYSIVARGRRPSLSGLAQDLSISVGTALDEGKIDIRMRLGAGEIRGRQLALGPIVIEEHLNHIAPGPFEQLRKDALAVTRSTADKPARTRMMRALRRKILIDLVRQAPTLAVNFSATGSGGKAAGQMRFVIARDFASDPMLKDETADGKALMARAWSKYVGATAEVSIPAALLAQLASNAQINGLRAKGILVRDGADYTCHASLREGQWSVNGKKFHPAAQLRPTTGQRYRQHGAASTTRS